MARTFEVKLHVIEDDETGELMILPSDREIAELEAAITEDEERASPRRRKTGAVIGAMRAHVELLRTRRNEALPRARCARYVVRTPTYGEYSEAEGEATVLDPETGDVRLDDRRFLRALLPVCVEGLSAEALDALEPAVALALWARLKMAISPSPDRLPFLLRLSGTGETAG